MTHELGSSTEGFSSRKEIRVGFDEKIQIMTTEEARKFAELLFKEWPVKKPNSGISRTIEIRGTTHEIHLSVESCFSSSHDFGNPMDISDFFIVGNPHPKLVLEFVPGQDIPTVKEVPFAIAIWNGDESECTELTANVQVEIGGEKLIGQPDPEGFSGSEWYLFGGKRFILANCDPERLSTLNVTFLSPH